LDGENGSDSKVGKLLQNSEGYSIDSRHSAVANRKNWDAIQNPQDDVRAELVPVGYLLGNQVQLRAQAVTQAKLSAEG
jgi:hypothetical protein